jgi:hypothetical protein
MKMKRMTKEDKIEATGRDERMEEGGGRDRKLKAES